MLKLLKIALVILLSLIIEGRSVASDKSVVAVLPFTIHSNENIDYVQQGIQDMLISRISASEKIDVLSKDLLKMRLQEMGTKELTLSDVYGLGKKITADYMVWGSITKIGNSVSIDGKLVNIATDNSPISIFAQSPGLDEIIPKINDFAQRINNHILGGPVETAPPVSAPIVPTANPPSPQSAREREIIAGMKVSKKGTFTGIPINPDFINAPNAPSLDTKVFWMSQQFNTELKGMDIGDVNNDGLNEVVVINSFNIFIYQRKEAALLLVQQITGAKTDQFLSVDVADINGNGTKEIIVTSMVRTILNSFVYEWRNGKFIQIASNLPWMLRVIYDSSGTPILLGQEFGPEQTFDSPIQQIDWNGKTYKAVGKMKIPEGLSVFGLTLDVLTANGAEKIIAFDEDNNIAIYDKTDKPLRKIHVFGGNTELLWKSGEIFGGSNNSFYPYRTNLFREIDDQTVKANVNLRILTYDTNKDGKKEFIIVKNISSTPTAFKNSQLYTTSEIYDMEWDSMGLSENWRTKKINGYVSDYQIKDIDNDGQNEIVLSVVLSVGMTLQEKSAIVAYKLTPPGDAALK